MHRRHLGPPHNCTPTYNYSYLAVNHVFWAILALLPSLLNIIGTLEAKTGACLLPTLINSYTSYTYNLSRQ